MTHNKNVTISAQLVMNSLSDGNVKIKMATIGERNENGMLIKNKDSISFSNSEYPLFFEHNRNLDNLIGTFTPLEPNGQDLLADAIISDEKVLRLVKSGAIRNASITYAMTDYYYDESEDAIVVVSARLVELSLVIDPADKSAQILNSIREENEMNDEQNKEILDAVSALKDELIKSIGESIKGIEDSSIKAIDERLGKPETDGETDEEILAENSAKELAKLKEKWGK
ncbi:MAG: hypothetical protein EOM50_11425 [Erysipelotrichia bacterium]|nr:hypothetical protein [Erysipelotrichia bacterium]